MLILRTRMFVEDATHFYFSCQISNFFILIVTKIIFIFL